MSNTPIAPSLSITKKADPVLRSKLLVGNLSLGGLSSVAAGTTSGSWVRVTPGSSLLLLLDLTKAGGTSLDVTIETVHDKDDNGETVRTIGTFSQMTATGTQRQSVTGCDQWVRFKGVAVGAIGGQYTVKGLMYPPCRA